MGVPRAFFVLAKNDGEQPLERVAKREGVAVGGGGGPAAALRAVAQGALGSEGRVALPLIEDVRAGGRVGTCRGCGHR